MRRLKIFRWTAALMVAITLAPAAASAQEDGTVTISGTFSMDYLSGESDLNWYLPGLTEVYFNGHEHTWTLTLHGTTQSHYLTNWASFARGTEIVTTSFDLEFFGPDAATLNGIVSDHLAGGEVVINLENYDDYNTVDYAYMRVWVSGGDPGVYPGTYFETGQDMGVDTLLPTDADGYPVVGTEPFSIEPDYIELGYFEIFSGTGGYIESLAGLVTFEAVTSILPGDYNNDGIVDAADYTVWRNNLGGPAGTLPNDPTGVAIGSAQYDAWRTNYGATLPPASSLADAAVPEPSSCVLVALLVLATTYRNRMTTH